MFASSESVQGAHTTTIQHKCTLLHNHYGAQLDLHAIHLMNVMLLTIIYANNVNSAHERLQGEKNIFLCQQFFVWSYTM